MRLMNGGTRILYEYIQHLGNYDHDFFITSTNYDPQEVQNLHEFKNELANFNNLGVEARIIKLLDHPTGKKIFSRISNYVPVPRIYPFISRRVIRKADVFHAPVDSVPGVIRQNKKIKIFFNSLDLIPLMIPAISTLYLDYTRRLVEKIRPGDNVLAISESTKNDLLSFRKDLDPNKIKVTYLGANKKVFNNLANREEIDATLKEINVSFPYYFLSINAHAKYKNIDFVIKGFIEFIRSTNSRDIALVLIGKKREEDFTIQLLEPEYRDRIIYFDFLPDRQLVHLYNGALGFIYLSLYEGFGLPILEAMQCGTPVICSNTSSMPEVAGNAAILIDPTNITDYCNSLDKMYRDHDLRKRLSEMGLCQSKKFSWEKYSADVISAYETM